MDQQEAKVFLSQGDNHFLLLEGLVVDTVHIDKSKKYIPIVYVPKMEKFYHVKVVEGEMTVDYSAEVTNI